MVGTRPPTANDSGELNGKVRKRKSSLVIVLRHAQAEKDDIRVLRTSDDRPTSKNLEAHIGPRGRNDSASG